MKILFIGHTFLQVNKLFMITHIWIDGLFQLFFFYFSVLAYDGWYQD